MPRLAREPRREADAQGTAGQTDRELCVQVTLTVGSLFSGIGGIDLGLQRAGCEILWQCEIDDYCQRVLAKHWPGVPKYGDIRELDAANLIPVDILAGGFPCQDISHAGTKAGITGGRSGLWSEYARLVGELRPRYVLVENVAALLGRGIDTVLGDLASLGYDAEWQCLSAANFGAPHIRDRVWIMAYAQGVPERPGLREGEQTWIRWAKLDNGGSGANVGHAHEGDRRSSRPRKDQTGTAGLFIGAGEPFRSDHWVIEPSVGRVADGIPRRVDRLIGLGNAVVPQIVEWIGRRIVEDASCQP